ncbi:MAG: hypothetical protein QXS02_04610 [Candidatus Thermoplasmatota archaeon]
MKMKKIVNTWIIVMLVLASLVSITSADDTSEPEQTEVVVDEDTLNETRIIDYQYGAIVRLLQLEKAILKGIVKGEMILSILKNKGVNTTELECIVSEMKILLDEVRSSDVNSTNATQIFVDLKHDAILLVKNFRDTLHDLLISNEILDELKERIRDVNTTEMHNLTFRIRHRIRLYNRNQMYRLCQMIGLNDTGIIDSYLNGNITMKELKSHLSRIMNQLTKEKRNMIFYEIKEGNIKSHIRSMQSVEDAKKTFNERRQHRLNNRLRLIESSTDIEGNVKTRLQERFKGEMEEKGKGGKGK